MEWNQFTIGAVVTAVGLIAYLAAHDIFSSLPGNFLFFGGILTMTWGTTNPAVYVFFKLAVVIIMFLVIFVAWVLFNARRERRKIPGHRRASDQRST